MRIRNRSVVALAITISAFVANLHAWDDATPAKPKANAEEVKVPDKVADRLKLKMDVDFRRTPLQEALAFVAAQIKTTIDIDGDALKSGGFTKNMPQTFKGEKLTAQEVIAKILQNYQDPQKPRNTIVIVVDETKKTITLTTKASADQQKLTPYDVFKK